MRPFLILSVSVLLQARGLGPCQGGGLRAVSSNPTVCLGDGLEADNLLAGYLGLRLGVCGNCMNTPL